MPQAYWMGIAADIAIVGMLLTTMSLLPQVLHLYRVRHTTGLSGATLVMRWFTAAVWFSYAFALHDRLMLADEFLFVVGALLSLCLFIRYVGSSWRLFAGVSIGVSAVVVAVNLNHQALIIFGFVGTVSSIARNVPQVVKCYRERDFTGVSVPAVLADAMQGLLWAIYAAMHLYVAPLVACSVVFASASMIAARVFVASRDCAAVAEFVPASALQLAA